ERVAVGPSSGADDELVSLEQPQDRGVGREQLRRPAHDLLEHRGGVELGREQAARARELLRQRARAALGLEQLASLERAARGAREIPRQLEIVVGEAALLREENEHERSLLCARCLDRRGEQRAVAVLVEDTPPVLTEAPVLGQVGGRKPTPAAAGR